jgi:ubiquinone biosynthesis UbiH/UbiF/VisC/COQ6 family hydroxylase
MQFDLIIVGGGLAGLSLACALRDSRLKIALIESASPPARTEGWDARVYAVTPANAAFLDRIGAWKHLDSERLCPIHAMRVRGDRAARLEFSAYESGIDELGWILESSLMACELWENVKRQKNVSLFFGATPNSLAIEYNAAALTLASGHVLSAQLVSGADGRNSWGRNVARLPAHETPYDEMGVVANFSCEKPHRNIARQWFREDGVLAWLPLAGDRISIVWSTPDTHANELIELAPETFADRVAAAGQHELGALALITPPAAFPLRLLRVTKTVAPRVALIGDAAHGIHPLSGHGINLGFQDASALANLLSAAPEWQDIGAERFLQRYQRARREETLLMQTATHALHRLFHETLPGAAPLRNLGLALTDKLPLAKNLLVRYAIGAL